MNERELREENEKLQRELDNALLTIGRIAMEDPEAIAEIERFRQIARETGWDRMIRDARYGHN